MKKKTYRVMTQARETNALKRIAKKLTESAGNISDNEWEEMSKYSSESSAASSSKPKNLQWTSIDEEDAEDDPIDGKKIKNLDKNVLIKDLIRRIEVLEREVLKKPMQELAQHLEKL